MAKKVWKFGYTRIPIGIFDEFKTNNYLNSTSSVLRGRIMTRYLYRQEKVGIVVMNPSRAS